MGPSSPSTIPLAVDAFWERLRDLGWVEEKDFIIDAHWAHGDLHRLQSLMDEAVERGPDILVTYTTAAGLAAKRATAIIPIVDAMMGGPSANGACRQPARPGGNLTGLSLAIGEGIGGKWLELLHEFVPRALTVAVIGNLDNPMTGKVVKELRAAAPKLGLRLRIINANTPEALTKGMSEARKHSQALVVLPDSFLMIQRQRVVELAARHKLPAIYGLREFVDAGGLIAYAPDMIVLFRRAAEYVGQDLKGCPPG